MSITDNRLRINCWQGTKTDFGRLHGNYIRGWLYFVMDGQTAQSSSDGVIFLAIGAHQVVRFGLFSKEENIDEKLEEIAEEIDGKTSIEEHEERAQFPAVGDTNTFYVSLTDGRMYRWDGTQYVVFGGYTAGDGISIENGEIKATGVCDGVKEYVDNELEQFAETVPHLRYMTEGEVDAIFEEVFDEPYITETR